MYEVLEKFYDTEHDRIYYQGDAYPGDGVHTDKERIAYLSGGKNKLGKPVIKAAESTTERERPADRSADAFPVDGQ